MRDSNKILSALNKAKNANKKLTSLIRQKNLKIFWLQHTILELNSTILDLRTNPPISPIQIWKILESILDHDKSFHFPQPVQMRVQNLNDEHKSIVKEINPRNVICITSIDEDKQTLKGNQRRKKLIFYKEEASENGILYKSFMINSDKNFSELCDEIDCLSWFLCVVNKNTIVGVRYYDIANNTLTLNDDCILEGVKNTVEISKDIIVKRLSARDAFIKIKTYYDNRVLFQKRAIGYKEQAGLNS